MKLLIFDIFADYGFVKKNYTTMSPLTFSILPRTVISGIIGAIVGNDKESNPEYFLEGSFISQKVVNEIKKVCLPQNLLKTTSKKHFYNFEEHKPTNIELLKDLKYRIYFSHSDSAFYDKVKEFLSSHCSFYTVSIGSAQYLADYRYAGEYEAELVSDDAFISIDSVVGKEAVKAINFDDCEIFTDLLPNRMKNSREVVEYREFLFDRRGEPLKVKLGDYYRVENGEQIVPM